LAKVTGPNQFSLVKGHRTTANVDDCYHYQLACAGTGIAHV